MLLPPGVTFLRCQAGASCSAFGSTVTVAYGSLPVNGSKTIQLIAKTNVSLNNQTVSLVASVTSRNNDPNLGDNTTGAGFSVSGIVPFVVDPPDAFDFGDAGVGQSVSKDITITANNLVDIQLVLLPADGVSANVFSFASGTTTRFTLRNNTRTFTVVFTPDSANTLTSQVDIVSSGFAQTITLQGQGTAASQKTRR